MKWLYLFIPIIFLILFLLIWKKHATAKFCQLLDLTYTEIEKLLQENRYYSVAEIRRITEKYSDSIEKLRIMKDPSSGKNAEVTRKLELLFNLENVLQKANLNYIAYEKKRYAEFFKEFDDSQSEAIIRDEDQMLILAGAGSGKTKTIEGLVNYLIGCKNVKPSEILLISFTKATVNDMNFRDLKGAEARTFHSIGLDIVKKGRPGDDPVSVFSGEKSKIIREFLDTPAEDPELLQILSDYYLYDLNPPETEGDDDKYELFSRQEVNKKGFLSYKSLIMSDSEYSVIGQRFKSKEEARIANYLFVHGINFKYEAKYKFQVNDGIHNAYRPDFYLTDYDIYLEHFGVTRNLEVPFTRNYPNASIQQKKYIDGMNWKFETHQKYGTTLLVTCSYHFTEGTIFQHLEKQLRDHGVEIKDPDPENLKKIFAKIIRTQNTQIDSFIKLLATFITQYKSTGKSDDPDGFAALYRLNEENPPYRKERTAKFLRIAEKAYMYYQAKLDEMHDIDFEDMINHACRIIQSDFVSKKISQQYGSYKHVLIDEYQDISAKRMQLASMICSMSGAKLFCVGDDWQSIYRFNGSDLTNILNFNRDFPEYMQLTLSNTYRNSQQLTDVASEFIQKNPAQIRKKIHSSKFCFNPVQVVTTYGEQFSYLLEVIREIHDLKQDASVYILGRYNHDLKMFKGTKNGISCKIKHDNQNNIDSVEISGFEEMDIRIATIHRSKGLQADYVIVIGLSSDKHGFPSRIENDPVLDLVLPLKDRYPFEEERRLFYVALTRTKNKVYLLTDAARPSEFVTEFKDMNNVIFREDITAKIPKAPTCPKCGRYLVEKSIQGKDSFWACPGFPGCSYTLPIINNHQNYLSYLTTKQFNVS